MTAHSKFTKFYRGTLFQALVVGMISFTQPGVWSAISGLGAGGLQTVTTANITNAIGYGTAVLLCPLFAFLINKWNLKGVVIISTLGMVFWSAGLYKNSKDGSQALIIAGSAISGVCAAAFWTSEATVAIMYPEPENRGLFIGIWQGLNKVGGLISGAITLSLNIKNNHAGSVSLKTYLVLIAIQCLGLPISFLLSSPDKVIRKDHVKIQTNAKGRPWQDQFKIFLRVLKRKEIIFLAPLFLSEAWFKAWQSNYITHHFSVRARALNSLLTAVIPGLTDLIAGYVLDTKKFKRSSKVKASSTFAVLIMTGSFVYSLATQKEFDLHPETDIDWSGSLRFARTFIPFQIFKIAGEFLYNWVYWVIGAYQFTSEEIPYCSGIIRSLESLGQCFAFIIGSVNSSDMTSLAVSVGVFFASVGPASYVVSLANDDEIVGVVAPEGNENAPEEKAPLDEVSEIDKEKVIENVTEKNVI